MKLVERKRNKAKPQFTPPCMSSLERPNKSRGHRMRRVSGYLKSLISISKIRVHPIRAVAAASNTCLAVKK